MIATTALVAHSLGAGNVEEARRQTASSLVIATSIQSAVALLVMIFRHEILYLTGAEGETAAIAARFLMISVPSLPLIALSMASATVLRAMGTSDHSIGGRASAPHAME